MKWSDCNDLPAAEFLHFLLSFLNILSDRESKNSLSGKMFTIIIQDFIPLLSLYKTKTLKK